MPQISPSKFCTLVPLTIWSSFRTKIGFWLEMILIISHESIFVDANQGSEEVAVGIRYVHKIRYPTGVSCVSGPKYRMIFAERFYLGDVDWGIIFHLWL